jgi:hypothetical protein
LSPKEQKLMKPKTKQNEACGENKTPKTKRSLRKVNDLLAGYFIPIGLELN